MQRTRFFFQTGFIVAALVLTLRNLLGLTKANIESYCPGGGLESILFYLKTSAFICATSGINLIMFLFLIGGTFLLGRAFCSWVCPIGAIMEFLGFAGDRGGMAGGTVWKGRAGLLRFGKLIMLAVFLIWTYQILDLMFRPFCPLYVVISGQEHEVAWWSKWLMLGIFFVSLFLPFFWCKVLCPLGGFLSVWKKVSPLSPVLDEEACVQCGKCEQACPQQIKILQEKRVTSGECTQCLSCIDSCPKSCMGLRLGYSPVRTTAAARFLKSSVIPLGVLLMMLGGLAFAFQYPLPTITRQFANFAGSANKQKIEMIVKGLRCRGTGTTFGKILEADPGVFSLEVYAAEHRAVVLIDPAITNGAQLSERIHEGFEFFDKKLGKNRVVKPFVVEEIK